MAHNPLTGEEEQHDFYPGALPGANADQMGVIRDNLFDDAKGLIRSDPRFKDLTFDGGDAGWDEEVTIGAEGATQPAIEEDVDAGWDEEITLGPPKGNDEIGYVSNLARLGADRGLDLIGRGARTVFQGLADVEEKFEMPQLVFGDGKGMRWVSYDEMQELKKSGVTENLLTETIPNALMDVDLGGESRDDVEDIKERFHAGDVTGTATAVVKFAVEMLATSIPDMIMVTYSTPMLVFYVAARSDEMAEARVRNTRLSEALAAGMDEEGAAQASQAYVGAADISSGERLKAAPWAALSAMLEKIGAKGIFSAGKVSEKVIKKIGTEAVQYGMKAVFKAGAKAGTNEAKTEAFQEGFLEYLGETLATDAEGEGLFANVSIAEGAERGAWGAVGGGIGGAGLGTVMAAPRLLIKPSDPAGDTDPNAPQGDMFGGDGDPATSEGDAADVVDTSFPETDVDAEGKAYTVPQAKEGEPQVEGQTSIFDEPDGGMSLEITAKEQAAIDAWEAKKAAAGASETTVEINDETGTPQTDGIESKIDEAATQVKPVSKEPAPVEPVATTDSQLIDAKELKVKINKTLKGTAEEQRPVRKAWVKLTDAIRERFPDVELPKLTGRVTGKGLSEFFQKLQEEADIAEVLPDLKTYLETVTQGKPAEIIQSLERLTGDVVSGIPSITIGEGGPLLTQLRAVVNTFNEAVKARAQKKGGGKHRNLIVWANTVGEFAAGIKRLVDEHAGSTALEGLPADFNDTLAAAIKIADKAQSPRETRTAKGNKTLNIDTNVKSLKKISDKLTIIAHQLAEAIASQEVGTSFDLLEQALVDLDALIKGSTPTTEGVKKTSKGRSGGTKGKGAATSSTTEAVTKAKKRSINEIAGDTADSLTHHELRRLAKHLGVSATGSKDTLIKAINNWDSKKAGKETSKKKESDSVIAERQAAAKADAQIKAEIKAEQKAESKAEGKQAEADVLAIAATGDTNALVNAVWDLGFDLDGMSVVTLRKIAKALGAKFGKNKAEVLDNITSTANEARIEHQKKSMAGEDAEIASEVEQHVPKEFHTGHVFHTIRNIKDVVGIIKDGLKKGTNLALDMMGQGVSMLGDVGTTVLIFKDNKTAYTVKSYQNDGLAKGGMKPVAIVTNETDTAVLRQLVATGLPVYSNGKKVNLKKQTADEKVKATAKEKADSKAVANFNKKWAAFEKKLDTMAQIADKTIEEIRTAITSIVFKKNAELRKEGWSDAHITRLRKLSKEQNRLFEQSENIGEYKTPSIEDAWLIEVNSYKLYGIKHGLTEAQVERLAVQTLEEEGGEIGNFAMAVEDAIKDARLKRRGTSEKNEREVKEKATGITTVNLKEYGGVDNYEVHGDGGLFLTTNADTAAAAKRIAKNVWNEGMSLKDAESLEYYGPTDAVVSEKNEREVKGADPDEVFDPQGPGISGRRGGGAQTRGSLLEFYGIEGENLEKVLKELGVSKAAADKLDLIYKSVSPAAAKKIIRAVTAFRKHKEALRLAIDIELAVGKRPSGDVIKSIMEFAEAIDQMPPPGVDAEITERVEAIAIYAENEGVSLDNAESILEAAGLITVGEFRDVEESTSGPEIDDYTGGQNDPRDEDPGRIQMRRGPNNDYADSDRPTNPSRSDRILLSRAMDKMRRFFDSLQRAPGALTAVAALKQVFSGEAKLIPNVTMQDVLKELSKALPKNHRYKILVERLLQLELTVPVKFYADKTDIEPDGSSEGVYEDGIYYREDGTPAGFQLLEAISVHYNPDEVVDSRFLHNLLHEMVHAASVHAYETDFTYRNHVIELWRQALVHLNNTTNINFSDEIKQALNSGTMPTEELVKLLLGFETGIRNYYGIVNPIEFIAEAHTNPRFQKFLSEAPIETTPPLTPLGGAYRAGKEGRITTLFKSFLVAITKFLGYSGRNNILYEILFISNENFLTQKQKDGVFKDINAGKLRVNREGTFLYKHFMRAEGETNGKEKVVPMASTTNDFIDESLRSMSGWNGVYLGVREALSKAGSVTAGALNLAYSNRDVIERNHRELFARAAKTVFRTVTNPLTLYVKAKLHSKSLAREFERKGYLILRRVQKLDGKARSQMYELMRNVTLAQVWPDKPLNHPANKHLWSKPNKKTGVTFLNPKTATMVKEARSKFLEMQKTDPETAALMMEMAALTKEIQKAKQDSALGALGASFGLDSTQVKALQAAKTAEDIEAVFPHTDEAVLLSLRIVKGDSDARKKQKTEAIEKAKDSNYVSTAAKTILHGTSIQGPYFPLRRYGDYVVTTTSQDEEEPLVIFVSSRWKAQKLSDDLNAKGRKTYVSTKINSQAVSSNLEEAAHEISRRLKGSDTKVMKARLHTALLEAMAENASYSSQLRRANIDGIFADDMGRAFEDYVHISKYTIGDLTTSHDIQTSLNMMTKLMTAEELTSEDRNTIGAVVNELANQNREDANDRDISDVQKVVGALGFFNFLGAPSYWVLNATQTYTVTMPYLASKWGSKSFGALGRAQKTVLDAATATMKSDDKSYEGFKAQLPAAARRVVERLEDDNVLQSTMSHEFGEILSPGAMTRLLGSAGPIGNATGMGLKMMEKVPEAVEYFNRISTALAAYNLSNGDLVATIDAVQATQFNYDSANRARLLKSLPIQAGGGARAIVTPIMMFKTYGIGVGRLLYGGMFDAIYKKGEERAQGLKVAGGLLLSHTIFGGVASGLMLAPLSMLLAIFNAAFREAGDEFDPDEAVEAYLNDLGFEAMAVMARRGLPAWALGIDLSKSINLSNLLWMGNDRYDFAEAGGVEQSIAGLLGPVAQYGISSVREGYLLFSGNNKGNWHDFLAAVIPLKLARGIIKGHKYGQEGLHTDADLQFLDADQITGWHQLAMGLGFRSTKIGSAMDAYYDEEARKRRRTKRRSELVVQMLRAKTSKAYKAVWEDVASFNAAQTRALDRINGGDRARLSSQRRTAQRLWDREHPR